MIDIVVCDPSVFALITGYGFVVAVGFWVERDDVPGICGSTQSVLSSEAFVMIL